MQRIVYQGPRTGFVAIEDGFTRLLQFAVPRQPHVRTGPPLKRTPLRREREPVVMPKVHSGYLPAKLLDLGGDQCRFTIDEDGTMCGAKGYPWCEKHRAVVTRRG